jgi:hypothetical protein
MRSRLVDGTWRRTQQALRTRFDMLYWECAKGCTLPAREVLLAVIQRDDRLE